MTDVTCLFGENLSPHALPVLPPNRHIIQVANVLNGPVRTMENVPMGDIFRGNEASETIDR